MKDYPQENKLVSNKVQESALEKLLVELHSLNENSSHLNLSLEKKLNKLVGSKPEQENDEKKYPEQPFEEKKLIEKLFTVIQYISREIKDIEHINERLSEII